MGWSGLVYVAIVVCWAAYLVPFALKRYDEATRKRSVDRFSAAMRVLGRKSSAQSRGTITTVKPTVRPSGEPSAVRVGGRPAEPPAEPPVEPPVEQGDRAQRAAARAAAFRRRRVLALLLALTALVAGVSALPAVQWWAPGVPAALTLGFLWLCHSQARRASDAYWDTAAVRDESEREASAGSDSAVGVDDEPTVVLDRDELPQVAVPVDTTDGGTLWDPVPVTLPTYVSKPKAHRTIRTIDLGEPGTWTSGRTEEDAALVERAEAQEAAEAGEPADSPAEEQHAVGG
ncbi:MAG: hypothetical protein GEU93_08225 [Propionibacteriales bacterium]|nr:hypothetical protein [Propionibacteriales bacterium]